MGNTSTISGKPDSITQRILDLSASFRVGENRSAQEIWNQIENRLSERNQTRIVSLQFNTLLRVAASLSILLIASFVLYRFNDVSVQTAYGEHKTVTLPDQSVVVLNAGSEIQFNNLSWILSRNVFFTGEAFFSVSKGEKFEVLSPNGITQVLGTQFNIISRGEIYRVACVEGKVRVNNRQKSSPVILSPGFQTGLEQNQLIPASSLNEHLTSWKEGEFYFDNSLLSDVLNTLELQYGVEIQSEKINRHYTGYFTNQNLDEALKLVCMPLNLKYDFINDKTIKISTKK